MTYARRVDLNQAEIVRGLRALGYSVRHTHSIGKGFPDIVIGKHGNNLLVEIKQDENEKLTHDELEFFASWQGAVMIGYSVEGIHAEFEIRFP